MFDVNFPLDYKFTYLDLALRGKEDTNRKKLTLNNSEISLPLNNRAIKKKNILKRYNFIFQKAATN